MEPHSGGRCRSQPCADIGGSPNTPHHLRQVCAHAVGHGQPSRRGGDGTVDHPTRKHAARALPPDVPPHRHRLRRRLGEQSGDTCRLPHFSPQPPLLLSGRRALHGRTGGQCGGGGTALYRAKALLGTLPLRARKMDGLRGRQGLGNGCVQPKRHRFLGRALPAQSRRRSTL